MRIETDGELTRVYLRQSSINTFMKCPERARHEFFLLDREKQYYTDASATGQALHHGLEGVMRGLINEPRDLEASCKLALRHINRVDGIRFVQNDLDTCMKFYRGWSEATFANVAIMDIASSPDLRVEEPFCLLVGQRDNVELWFEGKMDAVTHDVVDWKTAARKYNEHEADRWHIQPTMYVWAASKLLLTTNRGFRYFVFPKVQKNPVIQEVSIRRSLGSTQFLIEQGWRIADFMIKMGTDNPWPVNDQHWLCSEKWCLNWAGCKGQYVH